MCPWTPTWSAPSSCGEAQLEEEIERQRQTQRQRDRVCVCVCVTDRAERKGWAETEHVLIQRLFAAHYLLPPSSSLLPPSSSWWHQDKRGLWAAWTERPLARISSPLRQFELQCRSHRCWRDCPSGCDCNCSSAVCALVEAQRTDETVLCRGAQHHHDVQQQRL